MFFVFKKFILVSSFSFSVLATVQYQLPAPKMKLEEKVLSGVIIVGVGAVLGVTISLTSYALYSLMRDVSCKCYERVCNTWKIYKKSK